MTIAAITIARAIRTGTIVVWVCSVLQLAIQAFTEAIALAPLIVPDALAFASVGQEKLPIIVGNTLNSAIATIMVTVIPTVIGMSCIMLDYGSIS